MESGNVERLRKFSLRYFERAGIVLKPNEAASLEVTDFGLDRFDEIGLVLHVYVNTPRVCAKELVLFPNQVCPEHRHPPVAGGAGKEETFRCRYGTVYLYVEGDPTSKPKGHVPDDLAGHFQVWHEIVLYPGDQYTLAPDTWHWFQAGPAGAVVSEFSTTSRDELDVFRCPQIRRVE